MAKVTRAGRILAPYLGNRYSRKGWMIAKGNWYDPTTFGFHVFTSLKSCGKIFNIHPGSKKVKLKVEVDGFLRSGTFVGKPSETWREMRILKVIRK